MCNILPDLVQFYLVIKLCTRDFSRINFAAKLSTNLVYNSIFVIDYE